MARTTPVEILATSSNEEERLSFLLQGRVHALLIADEHDDHDEHLLRMNRDFIEYRFRQRLLRYERRTTRLSRLYTLSNVIVIAGGLVTSGTIALGDPSNHWTQGFLIFIGLLVGVLTAINQIVRPGARSATYAGAAADLRQEGWDFLHRRDRYESAESDRVRYAAFVTQISEINRRAEAPQPPIETTANPSELQTGAT